MRLFKSAHEEWQVARVTEDFGAEQARNLDVDMLSILPHTLTPSEKLLGEHETIAHRPIEQLQDRFLLLPSSTQRSSERCH